MKYSFARAAFWALSYILAALLPLAVAYVGPAEARTFWIEVGVGLGFVGMSLMLLQFLFTGRYPQLAESFGSDSMLQYHRQVGLVAMVFILAHPAILFLTDPVYLEYLDPRVDWMRALALAAVIGALLLLVATSLWRLTFRLAYEWWRAAHGVLALFIVFIGLVHILQVGYYVAEFWKQSFFVLGTASAVGLLVNTRVVRPWRMKRRPYEVLEVREERGDAWTLVLAPEGHGGMRFRPGQFAWITMNDTPFSLQQNPYSFSSSADDAPTRLEFTIKVEGDFSRSVSDVEPGQTAFLEGPFGFFVPNRQPDLGCVMIVGGVGVTPCMSMIRTFGARGDPRPLQLIYANVTLDGCIFYEELEELQNDLHLDIVHVIENPPEGWDGERGLIDRELLARYLPENRHGSEYFMCGPEPMMNIAETSLREMGIHWNRLLSERFDMV